MDARPSPPGGQQEAADAGPPIPLRTLLYRFLFFSWLFDDMSRAKDLFERHAVWQHNRSMRRYLPLYLRRWSALTVMGFGLGCLFEQLLHTIIIAAWFYTGSCVTLTGMVLISVMWVLLANQERA